MNQTILGKDALSFRAQLKNKTYFAIALAVAVLVCNIVFVFLSNENNYKIFLWGNVATDYVAGMFLVWYLSAKIIPERKVLCLYNNVKEEFCGIVQTISDETLRYADFDCRTAQVSDKIFYLTDNGEITLEVGKTYNLQTVSKIIVSATEQTTKAEAVAKDADVETDKEQSKRSASQVTSTEKSVNTQVLTTKEANDETEKEAEASAKDLAKAVSDDE